MDSDSFARDEVSRIGSRCMMRAVQTRMSSRPRSSAFRPIGARLIRFPETYGVLREAELEYDRDGFAQARAHLGQ